MLEIRIEDETVFLVGRFDASQVETASETLGSIHHSVVLDLSELEYISSAGLGILIACFKRLRDEGNSLRVSNVSSRVLNLLRLAGLDKVLGIEERPGL